MSLNSKRPRLNALALAMALAVGTFPMAVSLPAQAKTATAPTTVDIPYEQFTLANGLRVIVHTDRKAPVVAVNIWYHVGSKDETPGRTRHMRTPPGAFQSPPA